MTKYKIRNRHVASLNTSGRALYYRYVKEENRDTEGWFVLGFFFIPLLVPNS